MKLTREFACFCNTHFKMITGIMTDNIILGNNNFRNVIYFWKTYFFPSEKQLCIMLGKL